MIFETHSALQILIIYGPNYRPLSEGDNALGSVCPSVCPFVCALMAEALDLRPSYFAWVSTLTLARLAM